MSIDVTNLSFSYGSREILHDLSFSIPDGCLVNVLGPNGVGKSTLFRCILGLSPHYSGTILVNGKDLRALSVRERAREISYIPQSHAPVYDYEVVDVVLMATGNDLKMLATPGEAQLQRAHEALARIGIEHLAHRTYTQISGGEQQLVLIARALAQNAQTIIMDEPTSALDYGNTMRVLSCVRQLAREGSPSCNRPTTPTTPFSIPMPPWCFPKAPLRRSATPAKSSPPSSSASCTASRWRSIPFMATRCASACPYAR